ncbi:MAG: CcmD family protein [Caldilineales bacterium]|nr:CcmD family protein [Caldilineales bacterium]
MFYLTLGMIIFWAVTFVFVFSVMRRQRRLEAEVEALREALREE